MNQQNKNLKMNSNSIKFIHFHTKTSKQSPVRFTNHLTQMASKNSIKNTKVNEIPSSKNNKESPNNSAKYIIAIAEEISNKISFLKNKCRRISGMIHFNEENQNPQKVLTSRRSSKSGFQTPLDPNLIHKETSGKCLTHRKNENHDNSKIAKKKCVCSPSFLSKDNVQYKPKLSSPNISKNDIPVSKHSNSHLKFISCSKNSPQKRSEAEIKSKPKEYFYEAQKIYSNNIIKNEPEKGIKTQNSKIKTNKQTPVSSPQPKSSRVPLHVFSVNLDLSKKKQVSPTKQKERNMNSPENEKPQNNDSSHPKSKSPQGEKSSLGIMNRRFSHVVESSKAI